MRDSLLRARVALPAALASFTLSAAVFALWRTGFVGLSNDDAARTLIAWNQSHAPTLDPTRSSWLPAHSWILALALRLHPDLLHTPRAVSFLSALFACGFAARLIRHTPPLSQFVTLFALALWPSSALCAASGGVPEMPCVALTLGALCLLSESSTVASAALAGLALSLAEGHRYEAWWASAAIVVAYAIDRRARRPTLALALCALLAPLFWVALNAHRHGDPLEFVHRVEAFRLREGPLPPLLARALRYPRIVAREAPFLALLALLGARHAWRTDRRNLALRTLPALAVFAMLTLGDARGGGPTHHAARALLLPLWMLSPLVAQGLSSLTARHPWRYALLAPLLALQLRVHLGRESSVEASTVRAGALVRATLDRGPNAPWLVALDRQDFLWIELLSAAPDRALPDRAYGASAPTPDALSAIARRAQAACVSDARTEQTLLGIGFSVVGREGGWAVLRRP